MTKAKPTVLTIAGLDPSGGAGIIADVETIASFSCHPAAVITAITYQNRSGIAGIEPESAETVRHQLIPLLSEHQPEALKTGMLPGAKVVKEVARIVRENCLPNLVIDPVMRSTSGYTLMDSDACIVLQQELIPLARIITPNIPEAESLVGCPITSEADMRFAAAKIRSMGCRAVVIKGGHLDAGATAGEAIDLLDDEGKVLVFRASWVPGGSLRGSGCRFAAAIAASLAQGLSLADSIATAKEFVAKQMRAAGDAVAARKCS